MQRLLERYSWETFFEMIVSWIYERYEIISEFLGTSNSSNDNKRNKITPIEPPYEAVNTMRNNVKPLSSQYKRLTEGSVRRIRLRR